MQDLEYEIIKVSEEEKDQRLDVALVGIFNEHTRSYLKKLITGGYVTVNDKIVKSGEKLKIDDVIKISFPKPEEYNLTPQDIPIDIVYQDEDIVVINKAKGMVVHPAVGNLSGTLVNALLYHIKDLSGIGGTIRPGIVHRIDKDTTGLLVVAKNDLAQNSLSEQIKKKVCKRFYTAIVHGAPSCSEGVVQTYIGRSHKDRKLMAVVQEGEGRLAITNYKLVEKFGLYSLMQYELQTGRTHQIRVHSKYLNIPIVGDFAYGAPKNPFKIQGQLLHAYKLVLIHPRTKKEMIFTAPIPEEFARVLTILRDKNNNK